MIYNMRGDEYHVGPVMLSDTYSSSVGAAKDGVGASQKALYDAYNLLNNNKANVSTVVSEITRDGNTFTAKNNSGTQLFTFTQKDDNTTYSAGTGLSLSGTTFSLPNSGVTAGTYGPSANVSGANGNTINVPQITVDAQGRITSVTNRVYTSVNTDSNTTYSAASGGGLSLSGTAFSIANSGVTAGTYGPSGNVTGSNTVQVNIPQITVNAKGQVTSVTNRVYTSVNTDTNTDTNTITYVQAKSVSIGTINANSVASGNFDAGIPSGAVGLGVAGFYVTGTNYTGTIVSQLYFSGGKIYYVVRNTFGNAATGITLAAHVIYRK